MASEALAQADHDPTAIKYYVKITEEFSMALKITSILLSIMTGFLSPVSSISAAEPCVSGQESNSSVQKFAQTGGDAAKRLLSSSSCVLHDFSSYEVKSPRPGLSPFWPTEYVGADLSQDLLLQLMKKIPGQSIPRRCGSD